MKSTFQHLIYKNKSNSFFEQWNEFEKSSDARIHKIVFEKDFTVWKYFFFTEHEKRAVH